MLIAFLFPVSLLNGASTNNVQKTAVILIYPNVWDANPDHSTIGKVVEEILKANPYKMTDYEYLVHHKHIWPRPREFAATLHLLPPRQLMNTDTAWNKVPLSQTNENLKSEAIHTYKSQFDNPWLRGLLLSSIRKNELMSISKNIYTQ